MNRSAECINATPSGYRSVAAAVIRQARHDLKLPPYCDDHISAKLFFESGDFAGWAEVAGTQASAITAWYWRNKPVSTPEEIRRKIHFKVAKEVA
jgi:hypothetical protein